MTTTPHGTSRLLVSHRVLHLHLALSSLLNTLSRQQLLLLIAVMRFLRACLYSSIVRLSAAFLPAAVQPPATRTAAGAAALRAATPTVVEGDAEAFERITLARRATKHFDRRAVPDDVLKKVIIQPPPAHRPVALDLDLALLLHPSGPRTSRHIPLVNPQISMKSRRIFPSGGLPMPPPNATEAAVSWRGYFPLPGDIQLVTVHNASDRIVSHRRRRRCCCIFFRLQVLALVLRAPSGFNIQPYECIVVTSDEAKQKLSSAMLGPNRER